MLHPQNTDPGHVAPRSVASRGSGGEGWLDEKAIRTRLREYDFWRWIRPWSATGDQVAGGSDQ